MGGMIIMTEQITIDEIFAMNETNPASDEHNLKLLTKYKMICRNKGLTQKTLDAFECDLKLFIRFIGDKSLKEVTHHDVEDFLFYCQEERKNSDQAINRKFTSLNSFYKTMIKKEYINTINPMDKLDKPKIRKKVKDYLTEEEMDKIFNYLEEQKDFRGLAFFHLAYSSACRISELHQLNRNTLSMEKREFKVLGKGEKERVCFFSERAREHIQRYIQSRKDVLGALFISRENNRWSKRAIQVFVKKTAKAVGITKHITPHSIRHSILTHLRLKGYPLEDLQLLAGHENIGTTQRTYVHVGLDEVRGKFDEFHAA
jgi:integrase/recombinase XerD